MRYFLHIGYDGSKYRGWQRQPNVNSIQETIENVIEKLFHHPINILGCGRTDAGVHASQFVFHINIDQIFDFDLKLRLNQNLPSEIVVYDVIEVTQNQHARFDATSRSYDYFIHLKPYPILSKYSSYYNFEYLNIELMHEAVSILLKYKDFRSFCKEPDKHNHTFCNILETKLYYNSSQQRIRFHIKADRFLKGMIRLIIRSLLKVGTEKISIEEFENQLINPEIEIHNKKPALPNGLYLSKINYPYVNFEPKNDFMSYLKEGLK